MTDKEFVLNVEPTAKVKRYPPGWMMTTRYGKVGSAWLTLANSENGSWKRLADLYRTEMLRKLES